MIHRKLVVLASLLVGFVNIALAGVGDLDMLNVRSQALSRRECLSSPISLTRKA